MWRERGRFCVVTKPPSEQGWRSARWVPGGVSGHHRQAEAPQPTAWVSSSPLASPLSRSSLGRVKLALGCAVSLRTSISIAPEVGGLSNRLSSTDVTQEYQTVSSRI